VTVAETVTWIKVERPFLDLAGVLTSSLQITGGLLLIALVMGTFMGLVLAWRRRRQGSTLDPVSLRLQTRS
jgi:membrane protease YdiL (CAAX protease family)